LNTKKTINNEKFFPVYASGVGLTSTENNLKSFESLLLKNEK